MVVQFKYGTGQILFAESYGTGTSDALAIAMDPDCCCVGTGTGTGSGTGTGTGSGSGTGTGTSGIDCAGCTLGTVPASRLITIGGIVLSDFAEPECCDPTTAPNLLNRPWLVTQYFGDCGVFTCCWRGNEDFCYVETLDENGDPIIVPQWNFFLQLGVQVVGADVKVGLTIGIRHSGATGGGGLLSSATFEKVFSGVSSINCLNSFGSFGPPTSTFIHTLDLCGYDFTLATASDSAV